MEKIFTVVVSNTSDGKVYEVTAEEIQAYLSNSGIFCTVTEKESK